MQNNHLWKLGTINVRTGREDQKLERIVHEINKANLSICALQEVRRLSQGSATIPKQINGTTNQYEVYWSGYARKRIHGVGLVVKVDPNIEVNDIIYVTSRIIVADITLYGCKLKVICCYAPTEEDTVSAKDIFYNKIKSLINKTEKDRKVICLGVRQPQLVGRIHRFVKIRLLKILNSMTMENASTPSLITAICLF